MYDQPHPTVPLLRGRPFPLSGLCSPSFPSDQAALSSLTPVVSTPLATPHLHVALNLFWNDIFMDYSILNIFGIIDMQVKIHGNNT